MTELTGIVPVLEESIYHAHDSLSSTGARRLLESPAKFRYAMDHPQPHKKAFDLGSAAHSKVLGTGYGVAVIPADILASNGATSTKAAKEFIADAYSQSLIPIKQAEFDEVTEMSEAVLRHPTARALLERPGQAEASVFATDPDTGVKLRARFDFLPDANDGRRVTVDLKTTGKEASKAGFAKSAASFEYEVQEGHYEHTLSLATGEEDPAMVFVVVETTAPYLVAVHQLDRDFREMGAAKAKRAREMYRACTDSGIWPGYPEGIGLLPPPVWAVYEFQDNYS